MVNDEVYITPVGRKLDALVALNVMGWYWGEIKSESYKQKYPTLYEKEFELIRPWPNGDGFSNWYLRRSICWHEWAQSPRYSTNIGAAWDVVGKVMQTAFSYRVQQSHESQAECIFDISGVSYYGYGKKEPEAICRAALKAVAVVAP
jgi:hypothetical protein